MASAKDAAIKNILDEFEKLSDILLEQLDYLGDFFRSKGEKKLNQILNKIKENEVLIDKFDVDLDNQIIKTIVLYKPVASDLRIIFAVYRITINLERIGDLIVKISDFVLKVNDFEFYEKTLPVLRKMLNLVAKNVKSAIFSFVNNDKDLAMKAIKNDKDIANLNKKYLSSTMKKSGLDKEIRALIINLSDINTISSAFERIGNQASNIAESSIYAIFGSNIRHKDITNL